MLLEIRSFSKHIRREAYGVADINKSVETIDDVYS